MPSLPTWDAPAYNLTFWVCARHEGLEAAMWTAIRFLIALFNYSDKCVRNGQKTWPGCMRQ